MKFKFKTLLVVLTGTVLFYTACRKEVKLNQKPEPPISKVDTVGPATGQIIRNITQTLSGAYGGVNINKGLILPDLTTIRQSKPLILGLVNLCSFFPDTVVNYKTVIGDTITSQTSGLFKFYFSCDTVKAPRVKGYPVFSALNGYVAYDSLATTGQTPGGLFAHNIKAFYEAKALDFDVPLAINGSTNKLISFNGSIKSFVDTASSKKTVIPSSVHAYYTLNKVTVDLTQNGDITAGAITFAAVGEFNGIKWYYEGVINFLGKHKADVIIKNKTYHVDLLTGKVTTT
ncbi:hypothetical protein SAMN05428975_1907 [Mucilaginibacter sp. OK268]|uniref:hypothetical protein n=1 Tax=Mucilaginibacter sp. OK268 TaxID=1881048 RepID=UPI000891E8A1|nr:hypothetical protein [Mucilaginibacter sp. OK268]SDP58052.1 hypothetical protein SAMN05428975_1907 [Mucilaginibacter sp. OK268]